MPKSLQILCYRSLLSSVVLMSLASVPAVAQVRTAFNPPVDPDGDLDSPGGGTRGEGCYSFEAGRSASPIAFSPQDSRLAQTQTARPKFRVLVSSSDAKYGVFTLQDMQGRVRYRADAIVLPEKGGIVTINLPTDVELAPSQTYRWFLEVLCSDTIDPNNPIAEGQVQRVVETPGSAVSPSRADLNFGVDSVPEILSRVASYRRANLWYEAIDVLVTARQEHPDDDRLNQPWIELLELAGITPQSL
jgi:hypothetical protein